MSEFLDKIFDNLEDKYQYNPFDHQLNYIVILFSKNETGPKQYGLGVKIKTSSYKYDEEKYVETLITNVDLISIFRYLKKLSMHEKRYMTDSEIITKLDNICKYSEEDKIELEKLFDEDFMAVIDCVDEKIYLSSKLKDQFTLFYLINSFLESLEKRNMDAIIKKSFIEVMTQTISLAMTNPNQQQIINPGVTDLSKFKK